MINDVILPENHRRGLSFTAQAVERALDEMEAVLSAGDARTTAIRLERVYSPEERARLLKAIAEMRRANARMVEDLDLGLAHRSEDQIIGSKTAHLWAILVDSMSKRLRGFGKLGADQSKRIDFHVNNLLQKLKQIS
ncbi:MAG: hypothetical protein HY563_04485 [Ignavibacteriales bacterium]|nr:hypothetical protein [Ignavibacteriales bacterium]